MNWGITVSNQIVTIQFSIPDSWGVDSFAAELGECYAELNTDNSDLVCIVGTTTDKGGK